MDKIHRRAGDLNCTKMIGCKARTPLFSIETTSMKRACLVLSLLIIGPAYAQQVYKCSENGKTTFSDVPCAKSSKAKTSIVSAKPNSIDASDGRSSDERDLMRREFARRTVSQSPAPTSRTEARDSAACRDATQSYETEVSSIRKDQAAVSMRKTKMLIACGRTDQLTTRQASHSMPSPSSKSPAVITSCDQGGCWDDQGGRYSKGAGNTYIGPNGACQMVGGMMNCP